LNSEDSKYWNSVSQQIPAGQDYDILLARHYRDSHLNLIRRWLEITPEMKILKTDLFAEAMCPERSFFHELLNSDCIFTAADISEEICLKAQYNGNSHKNGIRYIATDIRSLPFENESFNAVISDSTLDHYKNKDDITVALKEIVRVLKPGGILLITMDNKSNITEPLFRIWLKLGLSPFYIGKTYNMKELKSALHELGLKVMDEYYLIHNPRFFAKLFIRLLRKVNSSKSDKRILRMLAFFDSLEAKRTRALTAQFIAVKAIKLDQFNNKFRT
jgi:ubiquinone/menaquinone biosynthesis C-methylase UbiE